MPVLCTSDLTNKRNCMNMLLGNSKPMTQAPLANFAKSIDRDSPCQAWFAFLLVRIQSIAKITDAGKMIICMHVYRTFDTSRQASLGKIAILADEATIRVFIPLSFCWANT